MPGAARLWYGRMHYLPKDALLPVDGNGSRATFGEWAAALQAAARDSELTSKQPRDDGSSDACGGPSVKASIGATAIDYGTDPRNCPLASPFSAARPIDGEVDETCSDGTNECFAILLPPGDDDGPRRRFSPPPAADPSPPPPTPPPLPTEAAPGVPYDPRRGAGLPLCRCDRYDNKAFQLMSRMCQKEYTNEYGNVQVCYPSTRVNIVNNDWSQGTVLNGRVYDNRCDYLMTMCSPWSPPSE